MKVSRPFLSQPNVTMNSCLYTISVPTILCTFYCLYKTFHPVADCKPWTVMKPIMTHLLSCPYVFYPFYVLYGLRCDLCLLTSSGNQTHSYAFSLFPSYDRDHQLVECLVLKKVSVLVVKFSGETKINKSIMF